MKFSRIVSGFTLVFFFSTSGVWADEGQLIQMMNDLQKQMTQMQRVMDQQNDKIRDLEKRQPSVQVAGPSSGEIVPPMSDYEFNERLGGALGGANK